MRRFFAFVVVCGMGLLAWAGIKTSDKPKGPPPCGSTTDAYFMAQTFVSRALKAPASASYPRSGDPEVKITHRGGCDYTVAGYVDSQNSFGANLRTRFIIDLQANPNDNTWTPGKLVFL